MQRFFFFILFLAAILQAQEQEGLGLILDDPKFETTPQSPILTRGDYSNLPPQSSLKKFAPTPGDQGRSSTCTGWATAYSAKTILEAENRKLSDHAPDSISFSPLFVYNLIRMRPGCSSGASLIDALDVLRNMGGMTMREFGNECDREVTQLDKQKAGKHRIIEYREIASMKTVDKAKFVKKALAEGKPVVIAFDCPLSFQKSGELWTPEKSDYKMWGRGHALTVIGYDDKKAGGAFEVINSWGSDWGSNGFAWIEYKDFNYFCKLAFEIVDPAMRDSQTPDLSGSLIFRDSNGDEMQVKYNGHYFEMTKPYACGSLFELRIANNEPAYVYAFASDTTSYITTQLFPINDRMLPYLPYRQNNIAIPDEDSYCILDTTKGISYYCFLYSRTPIDIKELTKNIEEINSGYWIRLVKALREKRVAEDDIKFDCSSGIEFKAWSKGRDVVPVLVAIRHF